MQCEGPQKEINMFRIDGYKLKYAVQGRCPFSGNRRGVEFEDVPNSEKTRFRNELFGVICWIFNSDLLQMSICCPHRK